MFFDEKTNAAIAERLFAHLENGTTDLAEGVVEFDPRAHMDSQLAAREREKIFARFPVLVGHASQLANPNDFITFSLTKGEALIVRKEDGGLAAFYNYCRHRGAKLVSEPSGRRRLFTCPYHGWTYGVDGALRHISYPDHFGKPPCNAIGLIALPVEERHGMIFVIEDPEAHLDVAAFLGPELDAIMAHYAIGSFHHERVRVIDCNMNWKVLQDLFLDSYHLHFLHPTTVGPHFYPYAATIDYFGRHARYITSRRSIDRIRAEPPGAVPLDKYVILANFVMPNTTLVLQPEHFEAWTFFPDAEDVKKSRAIIRYWTPEPVTSDEQAKHWERNWDILMSAVKYEDLPVGEGMQESAGARGIGKMLLGRNEVANQHFHRQLAIALAE